MEIVPRGRVDAIGARHLVSGHRCLPPGVLRSEYPDSCAALVRLRSSDTARPSATERNETVMTPSGSQLSRLPSHFRRQGRDTSGCDFRIVRGLSCPQPVRLRELDRGVHRRRSDGRHRRRRRSTGRRCHDLLPGKAGDHHVRRSQAVRSRKQGERATRQLAGARTFSGVEKLSISAPGTNWKTTSSSGHSRETDSSPSRASPLRTTRRPLVEPASGPETLLRWIPTRFG